MQAQRRFFSGGQSIHVQRKRVDRSKRLTCRVSSTGGLVVRASDR